MGNKEEYAIRIGDIIQKKTGRKLPRPVIRLMEKFIHQDFINTYLTKGYEGLEFCDQCLRYLDIDIEVEGLENVSAPQGARLTYASNHPLGGADGIALISIIGKKEDLSS
jgi:hypothetical protein